VHHLRRRMKKQKGPNFVNFVPNKLKYLVKREEAISVTEGGIYVPEQNQERPMEGRVLAVGGGDPIFQIDDRILFGKYDGVEVNVDGVEYLILDEGQILGKRIGPK
jgi:chaperonin GroES